MQQIDPHLPETHGLSASASQTAPQYRPRRQLVIATVGIVVSALYAAIVAKNVAAIVTKHGSVVSPAGVIRSALAVPGTSLPIEFEVGITTVVVVILVFSLVLLLSGTHTLSTGASDSSASSRTPRTTSSVSPGALNDEYVDTTQVHALTSATVSSSIVKPSIFVSHSSADNEFGVWLARQLRERLGADVYYDADSIIAGGDDWMRRIEDEISTRNVFVLILSPAATESPWVSKELRLALSSAIGSRKVVIPVLHQETSTHFSPFLAQYQMVRFAGRDHEQALTELMEAVQLGESRIREAVTTSLERRGPPFDLNLLPVTDHFVGRETELVWLLEHLQPSYAAAEVATIAAVNGLAGIGKSALAAKAVQQFFVENRFPDGIAVISSDEVRDPATLLRLVLARFDDFGREPGSSDLVELRKLAAEEFAGKRALVLLDNVEPNWPIEQVVGPLRTAGVSILLTSRAPLPATAVPTRSSLSLSELSPEQAIDLFARVAGYGSAEELLSNDRQAVSRIVYALGNHPLAVRLATAYAAQTQRDLFTLANEFEAGPQRTLGLADGSETVSVLLDRSLATLPAAAARLFETSAAFASSDIGRRAILAVAADLDLGDSNVPMMVDRLIRLSLLEPTVAETLPLESDQERLRLHPLVRTLAEQRFGMWHESDRKVASTAVASWYATYVNDVPDVAKLHDSNNILGALQWLHDVDSVDPHSDDLTIRLCTGMSTAWRDTGSTYATLTYLPWGISAAERSALMEAASTRRLQAAILRVAYSLALLWSGSTPEAEATLRSSLTVLRQEGAHHEQGVALSRLGDLLLQRGDAVDAERCYGEALQLLRASQDRREEGLALSRLAEIVSQTDATAALDDYEEALKVLTEAHAFHEQGITLSQLGDVLLGLGNVTDARQRYEDALRILRETGDRREEGKTLSRLGDILLREGDLEAAQEHYEHALAILRETRDRRNEAAVLGHLADVILQGSPGSSRSRNLNEGVAMAQAPQQDRDEHTALEKANEYIDQALKIARDVNNRPNEAALLSRLGDIALRRERMDQNLNYFDQARKRYEQALAILREIHSRREQGIIHGKLAGIFQRQHDSVEAQRNFEKARLLFEEVGDHSYEAAAMLALAKLVETTGDLDRSERLLRDSTKISAMGVDRGRHADSMQELGRFLIERRQKRGEGCRLLHMAIREYGEMHLHDEERARKLAHRLGCVDSKQLEARAQAASSVSEIDHSVDSAKSPAELFEGLSSLSDLELAPARARSASPLGSHDTDTMLGVPSRSVTVAVGEMSDPIPQPTKPRIFLSHAGVDHLFASKLAGDLCQALNDEDAVWYDRNAPQPDRNNGLVGGDVWLAEIEMQLTTRDVFVVVLSPAATDSPWVRTETYLALTQMNSYKHLTIIPVLYEDCQPSPLLGLIQQVRFLGRVYQQALDELVGVIREGHTRAARREGSPPFDLDLLQPPPNFIGREADLTWVLQQVRKGGTAAITAIRGMGGIGKTALAAVALRVLYAEGAFPQGIGVVDCRKQRDPLDILRRALTRFDRQRQPPQATDLGGMRDAARDILLGRHTLIVLDNVEPDDPSPDGYWKIARVVGPLAAQGASILITARQTMPSSVVPPEASRSLDLLSSEEARDLFMDTYALRPFSDLSPNERAAVQSIITILACHTLAVKLAASLSAEPRDLITLANELEDVERRLDLENPDEPPGLAGVRRAFEASYDALQPSEKQLFAALAAFRSSEFGRSAALALAKHLNPQASPGARDQLVSLLIRRSLVDASVETALSVEENRERLRLHPLLRDFAESEFHRQATVEHMALFSTAERAEIHRSLALYYGGYVQVASQLAIGIDEVNINGARTWALDNNERELAGVLDASLQEYWGDQWKADSTIRYLP
jgi:tetratricopeptide (TPR) repeat protein